MKVARTMLSRGVDRGNFKVLSIVTVKKKDLSMKSLYNLIINVSKNNKNPFKKFKGALISLSLIVNYSITVVRG
ncbi:hypothetical protein DUD82_26825 [Bacillus toyonensis]